MKSKSPSDAWGVLFAVGVAVVCLAAIALFITAVVVGVSWGISWGWHSGIH